MKEGWKKYNLMDICNVTTGKHDANHADEDGKYRFYTCSSQYVYCNTKRYEGECIILPGNGVNVGESYYYNGEFDAYQRTYVIDKIDKGIIPMYLYYHLQNNWKTEGVAKQYGSATNYIKIGNFKDYIVKTPPTLSEQQSIVDYLDSAFAKIDAMKANAGKALNEAKALFQASLKEMLEPKKGWEENTLRDISLIYGNYGLSVPSTEYNGVRYLRITDITEWGELNDEKVSAKIDDGKEQELLEEGDILFARTGATVGKTLMYKEEFGDCLFAGYLIRYRLKKEIINPKFMFYITHSDEYYKWVLDNQKAAAQPNISAKLYNNYKVSYPPLSEQQSIVANLDSLKSKVDRLQENFDKISQECDALKQAILRQVFE